MALKFQQFSRKNPLIFWLMAQPLHASSRKIRLTFRAPCLTQKIGTSRHEIDSLSLNDNGSDEPLMGTQARRLGPYSAGSRATNRRD